MWICQRCQAENRDGARVCLVCGTARAAGRFGSAAQQHPAAASAPRVTAAQPTQAQPVPTQEPAMPSPVHSGYQPPEENARVPRASRGKGSGFASFVGIALLVLLPMLTVLAAAVLFVYWQSLMQTWQQLISTYPEAAFKLIGSKIPTWLGWVCYGVIALTAFLLSLLPGLWTLLLNRKSR